VYQIFEFPGKKLEFICQKRSFTWYHIYIKIFLR